MNAEKTVGHLLDLLADTKSWMHCPHSVVSHYQWQTGLDTVVDVDERLAFGVEYIEQVERICG